MKAALNLVPDADAAATLEHFDWPRVLQQLDAQGHAMLPGLLTPDACDRVASLYDRPALFRSKVTMARHGFGRGEYQYFAYPLPAPVGELREAL